MSKAFERLTGKIKFFKKEGGWGFITSSEGEDLFFHVSNIENLDMEQNIKPNSEVEFMHTSVSEKGTEAKAIRIIQ